MGIDRRCDLVVHKIGHQRVRVVHLLGDLNLVPSRQGHKGPVVVRVCSVELVPVEVDAGKRDRSLDVSLVVARVVHKVEGVAGVSTKRVCLLRRPLEDIHVESVAVHGVIGHVR